MMLFEFDITEPSGENLLLLVAEVEALLINVLLFDGVQGDIEPLFVAVGDILLPFAVKLLLIEAVEGKCLLAGVRLIEVVEGDS